MPVPVQDPCAQHNLWEAHSPTPSADGRLVYVVCGCGARRAITPARWRAEKGRRTRAQRQRAGVGEPPSGTA
jgi:hypothetical protein